MLGFAPISAATLGGSGVARPIVNQVLSGVAATVSLSSISVKASSTISEIAIRKPNTTFFYDPNSDGIGSFRNNEHPFVSFANYFILGFDPSLATTPNNSLEPSWGGTYPHAEKFGITATVSDGPITYQGAHAPLVNGEYTFPATVNDAGLAQYQQAPHLFHLPETITSGAVTISSLSDPLLATLTFPATDPGLFSVIVGQVRTLNTYDETDSDTYFSQSLMSSGVGEITLPGENKSRELFHLFADKGFQIGPVSVGSFGTDKTSLTAGAAWVLYGMKLQPQITASNFPDGTPVSQEHTFLVTSALGQIKPVVTANLVGVFATATLGNVQPNISASVDGLLIGTALTPDPPWYVNPSRVQLVAKANQAADSAVYPYLPGPFDSGPLQQDFDIALSLGALASPIGVDVPVSAVPTITAAIGQVTTRSFNTVPIPSLPAITTAVGNLEGEPTEIVSDSFNITVALGAITTTSVANATATSFAFGVSFNSVTPVANSNVFPTGFGTVFSLNSSLTLTGLANHGLQSQVATVRLSALRKQVYATITSSKQMPPALPNFVKLSPANSNFAVVDRKTNQSVVSAKLTGLG
jgi:hypothetical protein